jgi:hypothetical protein
MLFLRADLDSARLDCQLPDASAKLIGETGEREERGHAVVVAVELSMSW